MSTIFKSPGGHVQPKPKKPGTDAAWLASHPGWKALTAKRWAANPAHQQQIAAAAMPKLESASELRAKAHAQTWKSIADMQGQLPTDAELARPYDAQRAAIAPLVQAHRDWLEKAGQYQTNVATALAGAAGTTQTAANTQQDAYAARAGAPADATPTTNVNVQAGSNPAAYGSIFGAYLSSLVPSATMMGAGNVGAVNRAQSDALAQREADRRKIIAQAGDLEQKNYANLSTTAVNEYKSELAALAAGQTNTVAGQKLKETIRHNTATEYTAGQNAATAAKRVANAITLAEKKQGVTFDAADKKALRAGLLSADKVYNTMGGKKGAGTGAHAGEYEVSILLNQPKPLFGSPAKPQKFTFYGKTREEATAKALHYKVVNKPDLTDPANPGFWTTNEAKYLGGPGGTSGTVTGQYGTYTRRMNAWRSLVSVNATLHSPLSTKALQDLFRSRYGQPG
jgi:hypothetical protein